MYIYMYVHIHGYVHKCIKIFKFNVKKQQYSIALDLKVLVQLPKQS